MKINRQKKTSIYIATGVFLVATLGIIILKVYNPSEEDFFIPCVFRTLTGLKCVGCGMTRAVHYLLNGYLQEALWYNFMCIPFILLLIYMDYRYLCYLIKDERIIDKKTKYILFFFLIILCIFGIVRNMTTLFY